MTENIGFAKADRIKKKKQKSGHQAKISPSLIQAIFLELSNALLTFVISEDYNRFIRAKNHIYILIYLYITQFSIK